VIVRCVRLSAHDNVSRRYFKDSPTRRDHGLPSRDGSLLGSSSFWFLRRSFLVCPSLLGFFFLCFLRLERLARRIPFIFLSEVTLSPESEAFSLFFVGEWRFLRIVVPLL